MLVSSRAVSRVSPDVAVAIPEVAAVVANAGTENALAQLNVCPLLDEISIYLIASQSSLKLPKMPNIKLVLLFRKRRCDGNSYIEGLSLREIYSLQWFKHPSPYFRADCFSQYGCHTR